MPEARARETAMLMLRRTRAGHRSRRLSQTRTGFKLDRAARPGDRAVLGEGLLEDDGQRVALSREGLFVADRCCASWFDGSRGRQPRRFNCGGADRRRAASLMTAAWNRPRALGLALR